MLGVISFHCLPPVAVHQRRPANPSPILLYSVTTQPTLGASNFIDLTGTKLMRGTWTDATVETTLTGSAWTRAEQSPTSRMTASSIFKRIESVPSKFCSRDLVLFSSAILRY